MTNYDTNKLIWACGPVTVCAFIEDECGILAAVYMCERHCLINATHRGFHTSYFLVMYLKKASVLIDTTHWSLS